MSKQVKLAVGRRSVVAVDKLLPLQGDLVEMSEENRAKLRKEILDTGFAFSPHVWRGKDGKIYILDGHQRLSVMRELKKDGYDVPAIPVTFVEAESVAEAKRRILQARSQYGHMTAQGLYDFMNDAKIDFGDVSTSFDFPSIDMDKFNSFFAPPDKEAQGSEEIEQGQFSNLVHTCPACGHRFGKA